MTTTEPELDDLAALITALESRALSGLVHRAYGDPTHPHYDVQVGQDEDAVILAARDLVRAVDELPPEDRPIGWDDYSCGPYSPSPVRP